MHGSTSLAQSITTANFKGLIQQFYRSVTGVLVRHNAMVNRLMGHQVIGLFMPRFAGAHHAEWQLPPPLIYSGQPAIPTGRASGSRWASASTPVWPTWGVVGTGSGVNEIAVLGSSPNLAARLTSQAAEGEVLLSKTSAAAASLATQAAVGRLLELKGISDPVPVLFLRLETSPDRAVR